jgi:hypothetical protein
MSHFPHLLTINTAEQQLRKTYCQRGKITDSKEKNIICYVVACSNKEAKKILKHGGRVIGNDIHFVLNITQITAMIPKLSEWDSAFRMISRKM